MRSVTAIGWSVVRQERLRVSALNEPLCSARCASVASRGPWRTELLNMQGDNTFRIESEQSSHRLFFNGQLIGTFATLNAAEAEATELARRVFAGTTLRFGLDFKWTLSDLEIRSVTVEAPRTPG